MAQMDLGQLNAVAQQTASGLQSLQKSFDQVLTKLQTTPAQGAPTKEQVFGAPNVRHGENVLGSRGFSFMKMFGLLTGAVPREKAKLEVDVHDRLHNCFVSEQGTGGYNYGGAGLPGQQKFLAPLATSYMHEGIVPYDFRKEMRDVVRAGTDGCDPDEMRWIRHKSLQARGYGQKTLSWLDEVAGGALVAPPEFGELIELLRNKEALVNAGARTIPLPPQGRIKYPRQTGPSTAYWIGENTQITDSDIQTGEVTLQAKKLAVMIKAPNELLRFASPAAEALMRDDMTKTLALRLDLSGLEGVGSDNSPKGVINYTDPKFSINTITSSDARPNGDALVAEDIYRMVAIVEEQNAQFESFIMRPKTMFKFYQLRADAVSQGDKRGLFIFNAIREPGAGTVETLAGYPVTKSTQVSMSRSKGSASNLTYIVGGMWSDMLIGMFGAIEFAATTMGDTAFSYDQTWVRGILSADVQLRRAAGFVLLDALDTTV